MKIKIDTKNKTIEIVEEIHITELIAELEGMLGEHISEYKISVPTVWYYPQVYPTYPTYPTTPIEPYYTTSKITTI